MQIKWQQKDICKTEIIHQWQSIEVDVKVSEEILITLKLKNQKTLIMMEEGCWFQQDLAKQSILQEKSLVLEKRFHNVKMVKSIVHKVIYFPHKKSRLLNNTQIHIKKVPNILIPQTYLYTPSDSKQPISYIRDMLSINEIRERLIFVDCEFVSGEFEIINGKKKGTILLASVCMMDYSGTVILNSMVTPTKKIRLYHTNITGFRPSD